MSQDDLGLQFTVKNRKIKGWGTYVPRPRVACTRGDKEFNYLNMLTREWIPFQHR